MSYETPVAPSLFDLIARSWSLSGPVESLCFNHDGGALAFAAGGGLAIVPLADPERPDSRVRVAADTGRATIAPRKTPVRPPARADKLRGPVAAFGDKSFVTGGPHGDLVSVTPRGQAVPLGARLEAPLTALARDPASSLIAAAGGARVTFVPEDGKSFEVATEAPVSALAFAPGGDVLAVGQPGGVGLWAGTDRLSSVALGDTPTHLSWSPDGGFLACGFETPGFALIRRADGSVDANPDYPTPVRGFGWNDGVFSTSGAYRTVAWALSPEGRGDPVEAGKAGLVIVDRVAACPTRPLIAVGYANGLLTLTRVGGRDEMPLRNDGAPITALEWSADGAHLAVGCADGAAALVSFPSHMFK